MTYDSNAVWYLAHSLATDEHYTYEQNMDHVLVVARLLVDAGIRVIAPWHTLCLALDDDNPEHRRVGIEIDCYVAAELRKIILTGHKLSRGMTKERDAVLVRKGYVLNLVGVKDKFLAETTLTMLLEFMQV